MKKDKKVYIIGGSILVAAVILSLIQSETQILNNETQISNDQTQVQQVTEESITGTPADNYSEKERPTHCGTTDAKSNSYIREFEIPTVCSQPVGIVVDDTGMVWFTETNTGNVGMFNPQTEEFAEFENEAWPQGYNSMMWGIALTEDNEIWFTDEKFDTLWKFSMDEKKYSAYQFTGNNTMKFPQLIVYNQGMFLINDFTGGKISIINHNELHSNSAIPIPIMIPEDFLTSPPAIDNDDNLWFFAWKYQSTMSLLKFEPTTHQITIFDLTGNILAPNGLSIDDNGNLWISDTATSNILRFEPETETITKYITSFPRIETFGNASGLIKTPITRPYWNAIYDDKLVFNEQQSNMMGVFDLNTEKLVEYLIPSKNPNWADCGDMIDCGLAQVFGFTKSGDEIWFTEWVENSIGVLDLSVELPVEIQTEPKEVYLKNGEKSTISLSITSSKISNEMQITSSVAEVEHIKVSPVKEKITEGVSQIPIEIEILEQAKPGKYKILIGVVVPDVTVSEFVTVIVEEAT